MEQLWDAIVIGSGIGGLAAASVLARVGGKRVVVLEKHSERGGLTHVFRRDGAAWDVGLHYVGDLAPGNLVRELVDYFSDDRLAWNQMPHDFERFIYPDRNFLVPADPDEYRAALIASFPAEKDAIRGYFRDIRRAAAWTTLGIRQEMLPAPAAAVVGWWRRLRSGLPTTTTDVALRRRGMSDELRGLLATQWGDYGLPPAASALATHALVVSHYLRGGWFPEGGAGRIARSIEPGIEAAGGGILISHEVSEILLEEGRAVGVRTVDHRGAVPVEREFRAPVVISTVGAEGTYDRLLPTSGPIGAATASTRDALHRLGRVASAVTLYLRLSEPVSNLGVQGENFWINTDYDHNDLQAQGAAVLAGHPRRAYLSFPSSKSGDDRFHTAELIAMVPADAFAAWDNTERGARGADYDALKERIGDGLLRLAESVLPGFSSLVTYRELATPLTVEHYTGHPQGRFYGAAGVPERYRDGFLTVSTPISGLLLGGSDAASSGIAGAMMGGVAAGARALGPRGFLDLMKLVRNSRPHPVSGDKEARPSNLVNRHRAVLRDRVALSPTVWRLDFELDEAITFEPGQYIRLRVAPLEWRDYSIVASEGRRITVMVSTRTGGDGSRFASSSPLGSVTAIEGPQGGFRLQPGARRRVFVATGTGLAPMLPMFARLRSDGQLTTATLLFGCREEDENLTRGFSTLPPDSVVCLSRGPAGPGVVPGRVTAALARADLDASRTDFYVCGSAAMVRDVTQFLHSVGASRLFTEPF